MPRKVALAAISLALSALLLSLGLAGCGSQEPSKNGQPIQPGDYTKEPGQAPVGTKK